MSYIKEKTAEELDLESMQQERDDSINRTRGAYINGYNLFWQSPQAYCDIAGVNAYKLFKDHSTTGQYLAQMIPDFVQLEIPEWAEVEFEDDGSVTITDNRETE